MAKFTSPYPLIISQAYKHAGHIAAFAELPSDLRDYLVWSQNFPWLLAPVGRFVFFLYRMVCLSTFCPFAWQAFIFYPLSYISNQVDNCWFICRWVCTGTWELTLLVCSSFFLVRVDSSISSHLWPVLYKNKIREITWPATMLAGLIASRLRSPASIVARHAITLIVRPGT